MLRVGVGQIPGGVQVLYKSLLGFFDGLRPVPGRDFGEVWDLWELSIGREVVAEDRE